MSVLKNFKNTPRSPPHRATGPKCNFFLNLQRGPWKKRGACRPCNGRQGPVAPPRATSGRAHPRARQGPVAPSAGDRGGLSPAPPRATGVSPSI